MSPRPRKTTVGSRMLELRPESVAELAKLIGVQTTDVYRYRSGTGAPGHKTRTRIEQLFGIAFLAWDTPFVPDATSEPVAEVVPINTTSYLHLEAEEQPPLGSALDEAIRLADRIRSQMRGHLTRGELTKLQAEERQAIALRAKLEREQELSEDRIVRSHPFWIELREAILRALKPYPKATKAVLDELDALKARG